MTASVQFVLRLELKFLSIEFFEINGFDKNSEIASTHLTDSADTYYREGCFLGIFCLLISFRHDESSFVAQTSKSKSPSDNYAPPPLAPS